MEHPEMHAIACTRCREKKLGCSRILPECGNCRESGNACAYPERVKRKSKTALTNTTRRTKISQGNSPDLSWRPEDRGRNHDASPPSTASVHMEERNLSGQFDYVFRTTSAKDDTWQSLDANRSHAQTPSTALSSASRTPISLSGSGSSIRYARSVPHSSRAFLPPKALDGIRQAVHEIRGRVVQQFTNAASISQGVEIPKDLARLWISEFIQHSPNDLFVNLIDMDLIKLLPDIIDRPHIRIDASILVIYFCILYYGSSLTDGKPCPSLHWPHRLYLCCLRALPGWQREAVGSQADFMAAICMMRTSMENFDAELAWQMHCCACTYAQELKLHQVDGAQDAAGAPVRDDDRKGFWELVQVDLYFRLVYGKPATLTASMDSWKVNLPWLSDDVERNEDTRVTIQFLMSSRLTFSITEFFHLMDNADSETKLEQLMDKVEQICIQVENISTEWNLEEWLKKLSQDLIQLWLVTDTALTGYCCIIFMLRRATAKIHKLDDLEATDAVVGRMRLVLRVSRRMLTTAHVILQAISRADILSVTMDVFRLDLPYIYLAGYLMYGRPDKESYEEDVALLCSITKDVKAISRDEEEIRPLLFAMQRLNMEIDATRDDDAS